jgi:hypothetical protein
LCRHPTAGGSHAWLSFWVIQAQYKGGLRRPALVKDTIGGVAESNEFHAFSTV